MRALGREMLKIWNDAMLQQCTQQHHHLTANLLQTAEADASGNGGAHKDWLSDAQDLRAAATEVAGRMGLDWENCEMRSIVLQWGPASFPGNNAGSVPVDAMQWLWADPGDSSVWFPGRSHVLCVLHNPLDHHQICYPFSSDRMSPARH